MRRFALLLLSSLFACGGGATGPTIPPGSTTSLTVVGDATRNLEYDETTDLRVRYEIDGEIGGGIEGATITWEILGSASGSSLAATTSVTDAAGEATMRLTSGSEDTTFRVRASASDGMSAEFMVAVDDDPAGGILVSLRYDGERDFDAFETYLYEGESCGSIDPERPPTALQAAPVVRDISAEPAFAGVAPGSSYAVAVIARIGSDAEGFGCTSGVIVDAGRQSGVTVEIDDLSDTPPDFQILGTYELDSQLDLGGTLPPSIQSAIDVIAEISDDDDIDGNAATEDWGVDPGAFLVDAVARTALCKWTCMSGDTFSSCEPTDHAFGDLSAVYTDRDSIDSANRDSSIARGIEFLGYTGCDVVLDFHVEAQTAINDQIASVAPDAVLHFTGLIGDLARSINDARIRSRLSVRENEELGAPITHELLQMIVTLRDLSGGDPVEYEIDLREAGFDSVSTDATAIITEDEIELPAHSFTLSYGALIEYLYENALLPALGYSSTAELLASWIDCAALGVWLADNLEGIPLDADDYEGYCDAGLAAGAVYLDDSIGDLVPGSGTLTLMGAATGTTPNASNVATMLEDGVWAGSWGEMGMSGDIDGTFVGTLSE